MLNDVTVSVNKCDRMSHSAHVSGDEISGWNQGSGGAEVNFNSVLQL